MYLVVKCCFNIGTNLSSMTTTEKKISSDLWIKIGHRLKTVTKKKVLCFLSFVNNRSLLIVFVYQIVINLITKKKLYLKSIILEIR